MGSEFILTWKIFYVLPFKCILCSVSFFSYKIFVMFLDTVPQALIAHSAHFKVLLLCLPLFIFSFTLSNLLLTSFIAETIFHFRSSIFFNAFHFSLLQDSILVPPQASRVCLLETLDNFICFFQYLLGAVLGTVLLMATLAVGCGYCSGSCLGV